MATLLLRLAAPLQSWGSDSKFETRKTDREPTKSGVVGLLAAALGLRRDDTEGLARLNGLRFAVRADQEGSLLVDFHTAKSRDTSYVTYRHYLQDAVFLAGLESEDEALLRVLEAALRHPVYPLYLGRRSCPPAHPAALSGHPAGEPAGRPPDGTHAGTKTGNREAAHRGRRRPGRPCGSAPAGSADVLQPGAPAVRVPPGARMAAGPAGNAGTDGARPHGGIAELR